MIGSKILIASAIAAVIMLSGVASQCTTTDGTNRTFPPGTLTHHATNCSLFFRCHGTLTIQLSCNAYDRWFDPCTSACQTNQGLCLRSCELQTTTGIWTTTTVTTPAGITTTAAITSAPTTTTTTTTTSTTPATTTTTQTTTTSTTTELNTFPPAPPTTSTTSASTTSTSTVVPPAPTVSNPTPPIIIPTPETTNPPCTDETDAACCCNALGGVDCTVRPWDVECCCDITFCDTATCGSLPGRSFWLF